MIHLLRQHSAARYPINLALNAYLVWRHAQNFGTPKDASLLAAKAWQHQLNTTEFRTWPEKLLCLVALVALDEAPSDSLSSVRRADAAGNIWQC